MATLHARADGNFTSAATWGTVDATSLLDSEANNSVLTTAYVSSSTFTPGAIEVDGVAVKIATRAASPTGTMSVRLFNATAAAAVAGTEVTINVSDIVSASLLRNGWLFLRFAAPVTLIAATNYTVQAMTSSATQVNLYRNATASNWARMLRTTTTAAPGAGDNWFVGGEWTAAATKTDRVVTYDGTAATDYGGGSTTLASAGVSNGGTLAFGTTGATNYVLRLSGNLVTWEGGTTTIGTVITPIPATSTAVVEFDCAADGDFGWTGWGTCTAQAPSKTHHYCLLNGDEAAGQTVLSVDRDLTTFWGSTDDIVIASTTRTASQAEVRTLNAIGASTITVSSGLTNAHGGVAPVQAEVANLTRIIEIRSVTSTNKAYVRFDGNAVADFDWCLFRYCGTGTQGKEGVSIGVTTTGSVSLTGCVVRDTEGEAISFDNTGTLGTMLIDSCVITGVGAGVHAIDTASATSVVTATITNTLIINAANTTSGIFVSLPNISLTNNRIQCNGQGIFLQTIGLILTGTISGNVIHSCSTYGLVVQDAQSAVISNHTVWRCNNTGLRLLSCAHLTFTGGSVFGCAQNIGLDPVSSTHVRLRGYVVNGDTTFSSTHGIDLIGNTSGGVFVLENCSFGVASGILTTHSTADVEVHSSSSSFGTVFWILNNNTLASSTELANKASMPGRSNILFLRHEGVAGTYRREYPALGTVTRETTVVRTVGRASQKLTPTAAPTTCRLESEPFRVPVRSGEAITPGLWVRKDAAYAGSTPRAFIRANPALGLDADLVLDSLTVAADIWERLTGTQNPIAEDDGVIEVIVDCDGSAGNVYVADATASTS
jgi:hypothetical protein